MPLLPVITKMTALLAILCTAYTRCVYNLGEDRFPLHVDTEPFKLGPLEACKDYL